MQHIQHKLSFTTKGKSFLDITAAVQQVVQDSCIEVGLCHLFLQHTSAGLLIQENADPDVLLDFKQFFAQLVPEGPHYRHSAEGADDMPAHIRTCLTKTSEQVPIKSSRLLLGTWQSIYLWEHRQQAHSRQLIVSLQGH